MKNSSGALRPRTENLEPQIRERLLQAAHDLVAEKGLAGFKVVDVAARARANVAMINYHFGSRDLLLDEVVRLQAGRVAGIRAERLAQLIARSGALQPSLEAVLRCWLEPFFESVGRSNNHSLMMLMVHTLFAADVDATRKAHLFDESFAVNSRFLDVIERCVPEVPRSALAWRMGCAVGSCYMIFGQQEALGWRPTAATVPTAAKKPSRRVMFEELVAFVLAGVRAPPLTPDPEFAIGAAPAARTSKSSRKA